MSVADLPWEELRKLLRMRSAEIGTLAKRGDKLAIAVEAAYRYLYDHRRDMQAHQNFRKAMQDYLHRDLLIGEVTDLGSKLGHRVPQ